MTIPQNILDEWSSLEAEAAAASPLLQASAATIKALQLNSQQLVTDVEAAQYSLAGNLDSWGAPTDPEIIIQQIVQIFGNAQDEADITRMRGLAGRVLSNLDQLGPRPRATRAPPFVIPIPPWPMLFQPAAWNFALATDLAVTSLPINVPAAVIALAATTPLSSRIVVPARAITLAATQPGQGASPTPAARAISLVGVAPTEVQTVTAPLVPPTASIATTRTIPLVSTRTIPSQFLTLTGPVPSILIHK